MSPPIITERLILRPFVAQDGDRVVELLNNFEVTRWLAKVPHPFTHADLRLVNKDGSARWPDLAAITMGDKVVGGISSDHLGYWIGQPYWGQGIASEAARAMVDYCFQTLGKDALDSGYFEGNAASARILAKLGFSETKRYMFYNRALDREAPNVDMILTRESWEARQ